MAVTPIVFNGIKVVYKEEEGVVVAELSIRLHRERSDFTVYATRPDVIKPSTSTIATLLLHKLLEATDIGVEEIIVKPYKLIVKHSRAVEPEPITRAMNDVLTNCKLEKS